MKKGLSKMLTVALLGGLTFLAGILLGRAQSTTADPFLKENAPVIQSQPAAEEGSERSAIVHPFGNDKPSLAGLDVEVQYVSFPLQKVEALLASGELNERSLAKLWAQGDGHLMASPRLTTQFGSQTTVRGVTECIYPTHFSFIAFSYDTTNTTATTNSPTGACCAGPQYITMEPQNFVMREVGSILSVSTDNKPDDDSSFHINLSVQLVEEPKWHNFGKRLSSVEQPFFFTYVFGGEARVKDGKRVVIGGGMPTPDRKNMVYIFLTAWIVDADGEPRSQP